MNPFQLITIQFYIAALSFAAAFAFKFEMHLVGFVGLLFMLYFCIYILVYGNDKKP